MNITGFAKSAKGKVLGRIPAWFRVAAILFANPLVFEGRMFQTASH